MKKILVKVVVAIDEQGIAKKYPNFKINYENLITISLDVLNHFGINI